LPCLDANGFESRWTPGRPSGTVRGPMTERLRSYAPMPAFAGHSAVEARKVAAAPTNDLPRGR